MELWGLALCDSLDFSVYVIDSGKGERLDRCRWEHGSLQCSGEPQWLPDPPTSSTTSLHLIPLMEKWTTIHVAHGWPLRRTGFGDVQASLKC